VQVNIDRVKADDKVDEGVLLRGGHSMQEGGGDGGACREGLANWDREDGCLGINIVDVNAALVREKDLVSLTSGGYANIVFRMRRVWDEGFDDERRQLAGDGSNLQSRM
jgi:hypothetical protein